jgi:hypothetical protein
MKAIMKNLKDQILDKSNHAIMYCPICQSEFSANKGDYWYINNLNHKFTCCGLTMELVNKITSYVKA